MTFSMPRRRLFGPIAAAAAIAVGATGCASRPSQSLPAVPGAEPAALRSGARSTDLLYVTTLDWNAGTGSVYVYDAYGKNRSSIGSIGFASGFPDGVWTDSRGRVYVAVVNAGSNGRGYVNVYTPGLKKLLRSFDTGLDGPSGGTFDAAGNLYVANLCGTLPSLSCSVFARSRDGIRVRAQAASPYTGYVAIFPKGASRPSAYLQDGINIAVGVTIDRAGNVFVPNNTGQAAWNVIEFPAGSSQGAPVPFKNLPEQLWVGAATIDPRGALVIGANESIAFFPRERGKPARTLTDGVFAPDGLAYGADGTLFAGNYEFEANEGNVIAFPPGKSAPARTYAVPYGNGVVSVAVGANL
ncbi:MAG TPA: hypothetical protein VJP76_08140 [Candidatus Tumulicola sp.]|nr:hypothetical protein [Candidatus Tumulicola sp.]